MSDKSLPESCADGSHEWALINTTMQRKVYYCIDCPARMVVEPYSDYGDSPHPNKIHGGRDPQ